MFGRVISIKLSEFIMKYRGINMSITSRDSLEIEN